MKHQRLKRKEQLEKGLDPLEAPEIRYCFRYIRKHKKSNIKDIYVQMYLDRLEKASIKKRTNMKLKRSRVIS